MIPIADIQRATATHFHLSREELLGSFRSRRYAWPRQVAMAIAREEGYSLPQIGRKFGRHHSTVLNATRVVSTLPKAFATDMAAIRADLARHTGIFVDVEQKLRAAEAIGAFLAAFGVSSEERALVETSQHGDTGNTGRISARRRRAKRISSGVLPVPVFFDTPRAPRVPRVESTHRGTREDT